jgi:hypothetical protein
MTTETDIANMALALMDEAPITSLEDNNKAARLAKLHYETCREAELMLHSWQFAIRTEEITGTDIDSENYSGLHWEYDTPADMLRLLPLTYDNELSGIPISWEQRDGKLYSDQSSPRSIRYIANLTDPDDWNSLFIEALAAAIAIKVAYALTHKTSMVEIAQRAYDRALARAHHANAVERPRKLHSASWAYQRGDTRHWRA